MPPKKKAPVKAGKTPKEKPANTSQEAWGEEKRRCSTAIADRKRRCIVTAEVCLSLGGG
jgi:hypothetical protein